MRKTDGFVDGNMEGFTHFNPKNSNSKKLTKLYLFIETFGGNKVLVLIFVAYCS